MKKQILVFAIVAALLVPASVMAADVTWGGGVSVEGYRDVTDGSLLTTGEYTGGVDQEASLTATIDLGQGVKFFTEVTLDDYTWAGDGDTQTPDVRQAYGSAPLLGGTLNFGRMEANWAHGLTTDESIRDRVSFVYSPGQVLGGPLTLLALWDLRGAGAATEYNQNMFAAAVIGYHLGSKTLWGLLGGYFVGSDDTAAGYILKDCLLISPIVETKLGPLGVKFGAHTILAVSDARPTFLDVYGVGLDEQVFNEFNAAAFVQLAVDMADVAGLQPKQVVIEAQVLYSMGGALIDGYKSWSSVIGDVAGSLGYVDSGNLLVAVRPTVELMPGLTAEVAAGMLMYMGDASSQTQDIFVDLGSTYEITQQAEVYVEFGMVLANADSAYTDGATHVAVGAEVSF